MSDFDRDSMGNGVDVVSTEDITRELDSYEKVRETKKQLGFTPAPRREQQ